MSIAISEPAPIHLRPGVLFVATRSGGTLMDLSGNRYMALGPESALIWSWLADGHGRAAVVEMLAQAECLDRHAAQSVLEQQLRFWHDAELVVDSGSLPTPLPRPKRPLEADAIDIDDNAGPRAPLSAILLSTLLVTEISYGRSLRNEGLARTLIRLQREAWSEPGDNPMPPVYSVLRAYHALRRPYKQSETAHDCLVRSLALTAALHRKGVHADLCIGVIDLPFQAHAWVEANGFVLNDTSTKRREYTVIGRF